MLIFFHDHVCYNYVSGCYIFVCMPYLCRLIYGVHEPGNVNSETSVPETIDNLATSTVCLKYRYCSPIDLVPNVPETMLHVVGSLFQTLEHCIAMYQKYAEYAGFDIRKSTG